jgi:hypothetical protein
MKATYATTLVAGLLTLSNANAQQTPPSLATPDKVETRVGTLDFKNGMPSNDTLAKVYDNLDFVHAFDAFMNTYQGVNIFDMRKGLLEAGVKDNEIIVFSELMDAKSLYLTANADTIYFHGFIDLSKGPMVFEAPPGSLGLIDDMWFRWVIDFGGPGPDRGEGGRYLILPPGYDGPVPEGVFYIARSRTSRVLAFGRSFMQNSDPKPVVDLIRRTAKIYPYTPGGPGTSIAEFLSGKSRLVPASQLAPQVFHEGTGKSIDTIPPSDFSYYELLNELVQQEPATSLDAELMGPIAAIGIVKGKPFAPDTRMQRTLSEAADLANATGRSLAMNPRDPRAYLYPGKAWFNPLFVGGADFETPAAQITSEGVKPYPRTGYRTLDARTSFFYFATGATPAMSMNLTGIGSQYLMVTVDANKDYFDGGQTYKVTLPKDIPQERFWSFTVYDNQTRSMLDTPQRYPRAGDQSYPSPAAEPNADGSTTVYFAPRQPAGVKRGNWIQTDPKKGWFTILRLYSPRQAFFDKTWQPSEIELVKSN